MSAKLVLYFTATEHTLYRWSGGALELESRFGADEEGLQEFRAHLRGRQGALVYVLADLAGEDFQEEQIPYLRGNDRQTVVQRRIAQRYRDTRLAAALSLGYTSGERRTERLLLASFTNTDQLTAWIDALVASGARLSGVYSVPLLAPVLAAQLGAPKGRILTVTVNSAGLRQCFTEEGRLRSKGEPALRDEFESLRFEKDKAVQEAVANSHDEITQLKRTAQALRDELETLRFEKDKAVQEAVANSHDEIQQLQKTAQALRDELENLRFEKDESVQRVVAEKHDEITQLKETAAALREELDAIKVRYEDKIQELGRASRDEIKQLQDTAAALRQKWEARDSGTGKGK